MYVLRFTHKNGEVYSIGASNNSALFSEVIKAYNWHTGYDPQVGLWSQDAEGCLTIEKLCWYGSDINMETHVDFKLVNEILEKVLKLR